MKHPITALCSVLLLSQTAQALTTYSVTSVNDSGTGSLRQAILSVNAAAVARIDHEFVIQFAIPGSGVRTIRPVSPLPEIRLRNLGLLTISGRTQNGFSGTPLIELNGEQAGIANGLHIGGGDVTVRAITINRFQGHGIHVQVADPLANGSTRASLTVEGCWIGLTADGLSAAGNTGSGISLNQDNGSAYSRIGGWGSEDGNVISGNGGSGISFTARDSADYYEFTASGVVMEQNFVGTNRHGLARVPNGGNGIDVTWESNYDQWPAGSVIIGGPGTSRRNVISGNRGHGLQVYTSGKLDALVMGNIVGLGSDGQTLLGNDGSGIAALNENVVVGGKNHGERNVISGNGSHGVLIVGNWYTEAPSTRLLGNCIGTESTGTAARPNHGAGVKVDVSSFAVIGDETDPDTGTNYICANVSGGVRIESSHAIICGAHIGLASNGQAMGNGGAGIFCAAGGVDVRRCVIGFNQTAGVRLTGRGESELLDNWIGVTPMGQPAGNFGPGVLVTTQLNPEFAWNGGVLIGGTEPGKGNRIAFNQGPGIAVPEVPGGESTTRLAIRRNEIHANGGLGIDLGAAGVLGNDPGDADDGVNHGQNFPVIHKVTASKVIGSIDTAAEKPVIIECFLAEADGTGFGEGRMFIGAVEVTTDAAGHADFVLPHLQLPQGSRVTATATLLLESGLFHDAFETSEFAANVPVTPEPGDFVITGTQAVQSVGESAPAAVVTVLRSGGSTGFAAVNYSVTAGTAAAGEDYQSVSGTLTFAGGVTQQTISVPLFDDGVDEAGETFTVVLGSPSLGSLISGPGTAVFTILDNDLPPEVSIRPGASIAEGNAGVAPLPVTIVLSAPSSFPVSVKCTTADGTATAGYDYAPAADTLTFAPGETSRTVSIPVIADVVAEADESVLLNLSNPVNAVIAVPQGQAVIVDEDLPGTISFEKAALSVTEPTEAKGIRVVRTSGSAGTVTVAWQVTGGTAGMGTDYSSFSTSGILTFLSGETAKQIIIYPLDDQSVEGAETVVLQLGSLTGGAVPGSTMQSVLTIVDDDTAPSISGRVEGGVPGFDPAAVTVTLTDTTSPASPLTVTPDWSGNYAFTSLAAGRSYTVRVTAEGWGFTPALRVFTRMRDSAVDVNFTAAPESLPELRMSPLPDGTTLLYWPATTSGWTPRMSSDLINWATVPGVVQTTAQWHSVTAPAAARLFFRLTRGDEASNEQ